VRDCGGNAGLVFSADGGVSWTERVVPNSKVQPHGSDPSIAIGSQNTIYFFYVAANSDGTEGHMFVTTTQNVTSPTPAWTNPVDLGVSHGIKNAVFPEATAASFGPNVQPADDARAAVGFVGTNQAGNYEGPTFPGVWYLFIATTYDHGATWNVVNATPNDPVQGQIGIWQGGGSNANRNLLDFNEVTYDEKGRILFGYDDGCLDDCIATPTAANATYGAAMRVARQTGGKSLISAFDGQTDTTIAKPAKAPCLAGARDQDGSHLEWVAPDNGGSDITGYKVYRGSSANGETLLFTTTNPSTKVTDAGAPEGGTLYYKVQAITSAGDGAFSNEVALISVVSGNSCVFPYKQVGGAGNPGTVPDPTTTGSFTIEHVNIGEPFLNCSDNSLTYLIKVQSLDPTGAGTAVLPQNAEYQVLFNVIGSDNLSHQIFVELDTFTPNSQAVPGISIGRRDPCSAGCGTFDSSVSSTIVSATYAADGTIQIKLDASNPIVFPIPDSPGIGPAFTWDPRASGIQMTSISGNAVLFAGAGAGFLETVSSTGGGNYTRVGNKSCSPSIPVAALTATPQSGKAPLAVSFNGTGSSEPAGACGTINSYTIDYGDGSAAQTNSTGLFSHTFNSAGTYNAQLTVSDTAGKSSSNTAQRLITVTEAGKPDLIVSALTSGNTQPPVGTRVTLTATVKNQGAGSAGASQTQFLDGKASLGVVNTGALGPGASAQVSVNWTPAKKGKHTIQATADKNKVVAESNENNNSKSITINVR
jgi:PKD repeat protein